ncbi:MAG: collagen-binding domain-containing protein, partial [Opitutales bacterium]
MNPSLPSSARPLRSREGSALVVALLFAFALGALIFPSYLRLSEASAQSSTRNFYGHAALELAESGLEHAVWALNEEYAGNTPWQGWQSRGNEVRRSLDDFTFNGNIVGQVEVRILNPGASDPLVLTRAAIQLPGQPKVERFVRGRFSTTSAASTGGGLFAYGMLARDSISASGGVSFDSWISDPDNDPGTPEVPYSSSVARDKAKVACANPGDGVISLGSSDVYGTAAIGGSSFRGLHMDWGGHVGPRNASDWDSADTTDLWMKDPPGWKVSTATGALTTGFTATFEPVTVPADISPTTTAPYQLPRIEAVQKSNEWATWTENEYVYEETIGADGIATNLSMDSLRVDSNATVTIRGAVTLILPQGGFDTFEVVQGGSLVLAEGASLAIYTAGDIEISGAGLVNEGAPKNLQIWGLGEESQDITFQGSGALSGVIYAPNADVLLPGDTDLFGSVVGRNITMEGSGKFHYDESLVNLDSSIPGAASPGGKRVAVE